MPRNGDGSSDNGPIDGHEILHGTSGDVRHSAHEIDTRTNTKRKETLQHTKHVAKMPQPEEGDGPYTPGLSRAAVLTYTQHSPA
jgi:hypothetical protein